MKAAMLLPSAAVFIAFGIHLARVGDTLAAGFCLALAAIFSLIAADA